MHLSAMADGVRAPKPSIFSYQSDVLYFSTGEVVSTDPDGNWVGPSRPETFFYLKISSSRSWLFFVPFHYSVLLTMVVLFLFASLVLGMFLYLYRSRQVFESNTATESLDPPADNTHE
jgi:hypothetical protein